MGKKKLIHGTNVELPLHINNFIKTSEIMENERFTFAVDTVVFTH